MEPHVQLVVSPIWTDADDELCVVHRSPAEVLRLSAALKICRVIQQIEWAVIRGHHREGRWFEGSNLHVLLDLGALHLDGL